MKFLFSFLLLTAPLWSFAQAPNQTPTAYAAMRSAMNTLPPGSPAKLVEVTGLQGQPAPSIWTVTFFDPEARADMRVVTVENGVVQSQKQPARGFTGAGQPPFIDITKLNVDSGAAFAIANQQAQVGFDAISYRLRPSAARDQPVWDLTLIDPQGTIAGTMEVAADDAALLSATYTPADNSVVGTQPTDGQDSFPVRAGRTLEKTGKDLKNSLFFVGGELEEFFTGERTIDVED